jgi:twitching motility two-component system response regulator PilH
MSKKALAVDDSPVDLTNIKTILTEAGCVVSTATNGKDAIAKAKAEKPEVIFLDIIMPDMDGYEACRLLAEDPATKGIPVVFCTSKGQKADKVWGQMQGAKGHVTKPATKDQVLEQLKTVA